jgi:hypothetical protein
MKLKECSECKEMTYLWKANPKLCKKCWLKISPSKTLKSKSDTYVHKNTKSSAYRIKSVSDKKLVELKQYRLLRDEYLATHKVCEHPECSNPSEDLHHAKGRLGSLLTDTRYFKALCRKCHRWVEENPTDAKSMGLSFSRLDID